MLAFDTADPALRGGIGMPRVDNETGTWMTLDHLAELVEGSTANPVDPK
ncbi:MULTISPECIES: hypothetical protein [Streptomyces]|nr:MULTISPECIES: hypothetical protein [Streptomyces]QGZ47554.1 hypothetical protein GPZ77_03345 [Streptomyces sp. QHH-9511]